jgi:uncharacterized protein YdcH (DUF465 family)
MCRIARGESKPIPEPPRTAPVWERRRNTPFTELRAMTELSNDLAEEFPDRADDIERLTRENARFEALRRRNRELWLRIQDLQSNPLDAVRDERKELEVERLGVLDEMSLILHESKNAPSQAREDGRP